MALNPAALSRGWRGSGLCLAAGLLLPLSFAPFGLWPLAPLCCLALLVGLQYTTPGQAAFRGWLFGVGFYGAGVSWVYVSIHQFGNAPVALAALLTALFVAGIALFFALHAWAWRRWLPDSRLAILLGIPALWVLAEWFRAWFLTGFPWLYLGYAPLDTWMSGWAPLVGVYGLSFWVALVASALYLLPSCDCLRFRTGLCTLILLPPLIGLGLQQYAWTTPKGPEPLQVALVQANIPQSLKWNPGHRQRIIDSYLALSEPYYDRDLLVWPETALPELFDRARPTLAPFEKHLIETQTGLVTGVPTRQISEGRPRYHNSVAGLGTADGLYHKQRLVPFGEYVPLEAWLRGLIDFFDLPMSSFSLGPDRQPPILLGDGTRLSTSICYEIVYPDLIAENGGDQDLLLTVSNDSWFGDSLAPHQHLQMARMRALETGRYLIRATNNGISALVRPDGRIQARAPQFKAAVLTGEVHAMSGRTPFATTGSLPLILLCALVLAGLILAEARRTRPTGKLN